MSRRLLITLPFATDLKRKILEAGFRTVEDVIIFDAHELSKIFQLTSEECYGILKTVKTTKALDIKSFEDVLREEFKDNRIQKIKTCCQSLDTKLNGGIPIGNVVEIYGPGGSGKTQFCYQLCVNVQLPIAQKGLDAEALFIDTESRFKTERIVEMAKHLSNEQDNSENQFLDRIHLVRVCRPEKLRMLILYHLGNFLTEHPKVKLIILDSVSYQWRFCSSDVDYQQRTREIYLLAHQLQIIAHKYSVAVVITNQVTRNLETEKLQPALGKTWSFTCSTKLFLERLDDDIGTKKLTLVKSRLKGPFTALFQIQSCGIVQMSSDDLSQTSD